MKRTTSPVIAGVMNIVIGSLNLLLVLGVIIVISWVSNDYYFDVEVIPFLWAAFIVLLIFSVPSIIGGVYALQRKNWVMALIGSITSFLSWNLIGLIPLILVIISKNEFAEYAKNTPQGNYWEIANERYARGEITKEEFEQMKKDLY
jgi:putative membrane protein